MLTSKQRAYLRSLANSAETILQVGKEGISENLIKQVDDALTARELIKGKVLETAPGFAGEIAAQLAEATGSEVVQVIGMRFVLFRRNLKNPKISLKKDDVRCVTDIQAGGGMDSEDRYSGGYLQPHP